MERVKKQYLLEKNILLIVGIISVSLVLFFIKSGNIRYNNNYINEVVKLDEQWYITGQEDRIINLPLSVKLEQNEAIKISRKIDKELFKENSGLSIRADYCDINVYLDNEVIYTYESSKEGIGKSDGRALFFVDLGDISNINSHELTIEYIPQFKIKSYNIRTPVIGDKGSIIVNYYFHGILKIFISAIFILMGILISIIYIFIVRKILDEIQILNIGFFSILCGCYLMCQIEWIYLIIPNRKIIYICEFLLLSLIGMPLLFIIYRCDEVRVKKIYRSLIIINLGNFIGQLIIYCLGKRELRAMLIYTHIILFSSGIIAVITIVKSKEKKVLKRSVIALVAGGMAETILYYIIECFEVGQCIIIGVLIFIILETTHQFKKCKRLYNEMQEKAFYQNLAYVDVLTGTYNRNSYENDISIIEKNKDNYKSIEVAVIDLNGLKNVNDTYGHITGDNMIRKFGEILRTTLSKNNKAYRIGGDEFIIIFLDNTKEKLRKELKKIDEKVQAYNLKSEIYISYALGTCEYNNIRHEKITDTILEADQKMYINKTEIKAGAIIS